MYASTWNDMDDLNYYEEEYFSETKQRFNNSRSIPLYREQNDINFNTRWRTPLQKKFHREPKNGLVTIYRPKRKLPRIENWLHNWKML